ncbi:MAG: N-acetyltransferase family protein [Pseudomonadota bacterium]
MYTIRPAQDADMTAIAAIYSHYVLGSTCTFETVPPTPQDMAARRAEVLSRGLPWLVAQDPDGSLLGYAYCNWFKPRPAYRHSAENSIYLSHTAVGRGVGRRLLDALCEAALAAGVRQVIAVIGGADNVASIGLHRKAGFGDAGVLQSAGWKFDRWLDVVLMQKPLGDGDSSSPG